MKIEAPSVKAERKAKEKADIEAKKTEAEDRLRGAMARTFSDNDGKIVLKWLQEQCGWNKPILGAVSGQIDEKATLYQAMRLNLYLSIRKYLSKEILMEVEYE